MNTPPFLITLDTITLEIQFQPNTILFVVSVHPIHNLLSFTEQFIDLNQEWMDL